LTVASTAGLPPSTNFRAPSPRTMRRTLRDVSDRQARQSAVIVISVSAPVWTESRSWSRCDVNSCNRVQPAFVGDVASSGGSGGGTTATNCPRTGCATTGPPEAPGGG
jgi:hypothetical protein